MLDGENKIIRRAIQGQSSAFGLLYDHYQPQIYRFVVLKVSRREEAEDLTHQAFLNAWQNIGSYQDLGFPFSSWLYHIARNLIIDFYRTQRPQVNLEEVDPEFAMSVLSTEELVAKRLEVERVKAAIQKLKTIYQDIIILRFIEELSIREVARVLKRSEGAVKLLQHRAMKQLKELLK